MVEVVVFILAAGGLMVWMAFIRRNPRRVGYGIAALVWLLNVAAFETMRIVFPHAIEETILSSWAQAILLQGALTLAGIGLILARLR